MFHTKFMDACKGCDDISGSESKKALLNENSVQWLLVTLSISSFPIKPQVYENILKVRWNHSLSVCVHQAIEIAAQQIS